jgi:hypothetical protein
VEPPDEKVATRLGGPDRDHLDPPLRGLVSLVNSGEWARTFGCCAGPASHGKGDDTYGFYLSIGVRDNAGARNLAAWHREVLLLAPHPEAMVRLRELDRHGLGHLRGWRGFHVSIEWPDGPRWRERRAFTRDAISRMEEAWLHLFG